MRLITRADFDGIVSAVFISEMEDISEIQFAHPKDMQQGLIEVKPGDAIANLPYNDKAVLWFDHHDKAEDVPEMPDVRGQCGVAPSAARLIYDFYKSPRLDKYLTMLRDCDKVDSAHLDLEDVLDPQGWILLSYTLDPRTALGGFREYSLKIIETIKAGKSIEEILKMPEVKERVDLFEQDEEALKEETVKNTKMHDNVIVTDFRTLDRIPAGGRFLVFALYPQGNVQVRMHWNHKRDRVVVAVGKSIFDRSCKTHVGHLMAEFGGGGLDGAGTCDFSTDEIDAKVDYIIRELKN